MKKRVGHVMSHVLPGPLKQSPDRENMEDVGVEGKRYPTNPFGRFFARRPLVALVSIVVPFVFFIIGCVHIKSDMVYTLDDFKLRTNVPARKAADTFNTVMDAWTETTSGADSLRLLLDLQGPRSRTRDTVELRTKINVEDLTVFCSTFPSNFDSCFDDFRNLLHPANMNFVTAVESQIQQMREFQAVCFTNDLEYGKINNIVPTCVPPTGIGQYVWPQYDATATDPSRLWHMNGLGGTAQEDYLPRLFVNPNYKWFFDANFSTLYQRATQLRTGLVLATTRRESDNTYRDQSKAFIRNAVSFVERSVSHDYIEVYIGGEVVENVKIEDEGSKEGYKIALAFVICFVLSWVHSGSFVVGLYAGAQVIFTYLATVGLYALIYKTLPLMTYSAVVWVMTFGLHGTLSFYDMFVFSGVMATKGRQNNLSVPQRICFTIRRVSSGVWLANVLAIVIFAINTTSVFDSVKQFSIFMMIAFLWNMYFIVLPTPAYVCVHHYYFSNKRRNLQKQTDVLNAAAAACRRDEASARVLAAVQANASVGEAVYVLDEDVMAARIGANRGVNKKHYHGFGDFVSQQVQEGVDKVRAARQDVRGAFHKARKTERWVLRRGDGHVGGGGGREAVRTGPPGTGGDAGVDGGAFEMGDFTEIGPSNPMDDAADTHRRALYFNRRMVRHADVVQVPTEHTERSEACWGAMCAAIRQRNDGAMAPPHVHSLRTVGNGERDVAGFEQRWTEVARDIGVTEQELSNVGSLVPLVARAAVRAQDPSFVVGGRVDGGAESGAAGNNGGAAHKEEDAAADGVAANSRDVSYTGVMPARVVNPGSAGFGLKKLRYRWANRQVQQRSRCCGMCGTVGDETAEERMSRLMSRKVKREGYTLFERFLIRVYVPVIFFLRYLLAIVLVVLFVLMCIFGSRINAAGLPTTLVDNDGGSSVAFASMDDSFGQRGTCTYCGPYYRPLDVYRTATAAEVAQCGRQMNVYPDYCGVCNGDNACLDCAGVANGQHVLQCNSCELPTAPTCTCAASHNCPYCQWMYNLTDVGGDQCTVTCDVSTCGSHGSCDAYTGTCNCDEGFTGAACDECEPWLVPIASNPSCTRECIRTNYDSTACACSTSYTCTTCPVSKRGYACNQPLIDCGSHGTYDFTRGGCVCDSGWGGTLCNASEVCHNRGTWLEADESPSGEAMCACVGHWRGPTCQLCDCLNGGYCDNETGQCHCGGSFSGARCQTCALTCVAHGSCPTVTAQYLDIRSCIYERCSAADIAAEQLCSACDTPQSTVTTPECNAYTTESDCNMNGNCWWYVLTSGSGMCFASLPTRVESVLNCVCNNSLVWSGTDCETCLAPEGATCNLDGTVTDCTGLVYTSATQAVGVDLCGVCGGDGLCRGCDGVPNSGLVYDSCGVCGGNDACIGLDIADPITVNYVLDLSRITSTLLTEIVAVTLTGFCTYVRAADSHGSTKPCLLEDYLKSTGSSTILSVQSLYDYCLANGRMSEAVFSMDTSGNVQTWTAMVYRVTLTNVDSGSTAEEVFNVRAVALKETEANFSASFSTTKVTLVVTSSAFPSAAAEVLSRQSLWFAVGLGLAVTFVFLLVYYVSLTAAVGGTLVAGIVCFGTLTVCTMFSDWKLDAVLQVCVSATIPIGVEYVIHLTNGYFDYLQTTTSHLFARDVSRKAALTGACLRSVPAVCTSVVAVILSAVMFDVSHLLPSKRSGQVCITMHMVLMVALIFFSGAAGAFGPVKSYKHWTLSVVLCAVCAVAAAVTVGIIYGVGGVWSPDGTRLLGGKWDG